VLAIRPGTWQVLDVRGGEDESRHEVVRVALEEGTIRGAERQIERSLDSFGGRGELYQGHRVSGGRREVSDLLLGQICYLVGVGIDRRPTRTRPVRAVSTDGALG
jgi:hypothetical protein